MLPFFRKIRWRLAADNQFFKYSRYAIGEIVLVVVGILIALYINNWNEERKSEEKVMELFKEVQRDLLLNLENIEFTISYQSRQDSLIRSILSDTLELEDYIEFPELINPLGGAAVTIFRKEGFTKLKNNQNEIPDKFIGIYDTIKLVFSTYETNMKQNADYENAVDNNSEKMVENWKWYSKVMTGGTESRNAETLDYIINDPIYKNRVFRFRNIMNDQNWIFMRAVCHWVYAMISQVTGVNNLPQIYSDLLQTDSDDFIGTYKWKDSVLDKKWGNREIYQDDLLRYQGNRIFELSKDSFATYYNNTLYFKRDSLGKVTSATRYWEGQFHELEKID